MELVCAEDLGPDASLALRAFPNNGLVSATPKPMSPVRDCVMSASSPLTRSPSPETRRRPRSPRLSSHDPRALRHQDCNLHPLTVLAKRERLYVVDRARFLDGTEVTPEMREEVVAWFLDMTEDLGLPGGTVGVAVNLFDRFLARRTVKKLVLHALASSCLVLACKVTDDDEVPMADIVTRSNVSIKDIHAMEQIVLSVLGWEVNVVTSHEVIAELERLGYVPGERAPMRQLATTETLMFNGMVEYPLAGLRATSIGVACGILTAAYASGRSLDMGWEMHPLYSLASRCGVDMDEVDFCMPILSCSLERTMDEASVDADVEENMDMEMGLDFDRFSSESEGGERQ